MSRRRRPAFRNPSAFTQPRSRRQLHVAIFAASAFGCEKLESRILLSSAFDITQLSNMRADPTFSGITGKGIGIAVLDTGVFAQNPDLQPNIVAFYDAVEQPVGSPIDTNFLQDAVDHVGHGSHVSGIAASSNPSIGVAYQASLVDVRVFADTGENQLAGDPIDRGLQWVALHAAQYNIKVVNMSLGTPGVNLNFTPALDQIGFDIQTLEGMGITVVSASGNSYANDPTLGASIPAVESTISVGNTFPDSGVGVYNFSGFFGETGDQWFAHQPSAAPDVFNATSQRSSLFNQLVAPGTDIFSTWNSPAQLHNTISGTSMASPFVAGTVALMQQAAFQFGGSYLSPTDVLQILRNTSDQISDPVNTANTRAQVQPDGSLGPQVPLPGTGLTFDRVNDYRAMQGVKAFSQGNTGFGGDQNNLISNASPLTPLTGINSDTASGSVGTDGSILVGLKDIDLYSVQLKAGGNLIVSLTPPPVTPVLFNPTLRIFDASGNQLFTSTGAANSYPTIGTPVGQPLPLGTYYIGVSATPNNTYSITNGSGIVAGTTEGAYNLTVTLSNPDPHGIPAAADTLTLTSPNTLLPNSSLGNVPAINITGVIGQETAPDGSTVLVPNGDVHFFSVVAPDTGDIIIQADADVKVFDSNNNPVGPEGSNITVPVQIGQVYFIGVTSQANANFDPTNPFARVAGSTSPVASFSMFVAFSNGDLNGTAAQAALQTIGTPITQQIGTDNGLPILGANSGFKDIDFYSFVAPSAGLLQLNATGASGFVPEMSLWTSSNGIVGVKHLADASETSPQLYEEVTAGQTVLVAITGKGNQNFNGVTDGSGSGGQTGSYTLNTSLQPLTLLKTLSNNSIKNGTPTPLPLAQPVTGNLGLDGNLVIGPNDIDMYSFTAPATREYQFATDTSLDGDAQTVLRVFDSVGNQIAVNQSASASSTNSLVSVPMTIGQTYYIGVSGVGPNAFTYNPLDASNSRAGSTGHYILTATDVGPIQRMLTFQQGQHTSYTDSAGHKITVTLTGPGIGTLIFFSPTDGADLGTLSLSGSDLTSTLSIRGATTLPTINVTGSLRALTAPTANLTGNLTLSGGLNTLQLNTATGGNMISIGGGGKLVATIKSLTNEALNSGEAITSITANSWTTSGATRFAISGPSINTLTVRGMFNEDVSVGTIGRMVVGNLVSSAVRASTSIDSVTAGSAQDSEIFAGVQPALTRLPSSTGDFSNPGSLLKSVTVRGGFSNTQIAAWNIGTVTLNNVTTANGGTPFGIAANNVSRIRVVPAGAKPQSYAKLFSPLAAISAGGDFTIRLIG